MAHRGETGRGDRRRADSAIRFLLTGVIVALGSAAPIGEVVGQGGEDNSNFRRGDVDTDGSVTLTDGVRTLGFLFLGGDPLSCADAADGDDNGSIELVDVVLLFNFLFLDGPSPPAPGAEGCGPDPTEDLLGCAEYVPSDPTLGCAFSPAFGELFHTGTVEIGFGVDSLVTADLTGDGRAELLVGLREHIVSLSLDPGGQFVESTREFTRDFQDLAPGDVNGDGFVDVAVQKDSIVSILFGDGSGDLDNRGRVFFGNNGSINAMAVADLNGDQALDFIGVGNELQVVLADGAGGFTEATAYPNISLQHNQDVQVGDFNADGSPDIVTGGAGFTLFLNAGDGTFLEGVAESPLELRDLVVGDFDEDGVVDIIGVTPFPSGDVAVLLGDGTGGFLDAGTFPLDAARLDVADLDGDGSLDVLGTGPSGFHTLLGFGDGSFIVRDSDTGPSWRILLLSTLGDFDGDGTPDVAVARRGTSFAGYFLGNGDGTFRNPPERVAFPLEGATAEIVLGDLNGDGIADVAASTGTTVNGVTEGGVTLLFGEGEGRLTLGPVFQDVAGTLALADFNGDERPDIATSVWTPAPNGRVGPGDLRVLVNEGRGNFREVATPYDRPNSAPDNLQAADVDGDGRTDIALLFHDSDTFLWSVDVFINRGDATFDPPRTVATELNGGGPNVALGDLDNDGDLDLVVPEGGSQNLLVATNQGGAFFSEPVRFHSGAGPVWVALGDVNLDGNLDAAAPSWGTGASGTTVSILLGTGDGGFAEPQRHGVGVGPNAVSIIDLNLDGNPDLLTTNGESTDFAVHRGKGEGEFERREPYGFLSDPGHVRIHDMDNDGDPDVVYGNRRIGIEVLLNQTRR